MNKLLTTGLIAGLALVGVQNAHAETQCGTGGFYVGAAAGVSIHQTKIKVKEVSDDIAKKKKLLEELQAAYAKYKPSGATALTEAEKATIAAQKKLVVDKIIEKFKITTGLDSDTVSPKVSDAAVQAILEGSALSALKGPLTEALLKGAFTKDTDSFVATNTDVQKKVWKEAFNKKIEENANALVAGLLDGSNTVLKTAFEKDGKILFTKAATDTAGTLTEIDLTKLGNGVYELDATTKKAKGTLVDAVSTQTRVGQDDGKLNTKQVEAQAKIDKVFDASADIGKKIKATDFDPGKLAADLKKEAEPFGTPDKDGNIKKSGNGFVAEGIVGYAYPVGGAALIGIEAFGGYDSYKSEITPNNADTKDSADKDKSKGVKVTRHAFFGATPIVKIVTPAGKVFIGAGVEIGRYEVDTTGAKSTDAHVDALTTFTDKVNEVRTTALSDSKKITDATTGVTDADKALEKKFVDEHLTPIPTPDAKPLSVADGNTYKKYDSKFKPAFVAKAGYEIDINPNVAVRLEYSIAFPREVLKESIWEVKDTVHTVKLGVLFTIAN